MTEVLRENFEQKYDQIVHDLQESSFVAVDCEFTGLCNEKLWSFESPKERFTKLQNSLRIHSIIQFGISTFRWDRMKNKFDSKTYIFYLMPSPYFSPSGRLTYQINSIKFLCNHGFDFNKAIYCGINYLNEKEELLVEKLINDETMPLVEYCNLISEYYAKVTKWSECASIGEETTLNFENEHDQFIIYLIHQKIRKKFEDVWTYHDNPRDLKLRKVTPAEKENLVANQFEDIELREKLLNSALGFTRIMKELKNLKKPIIGHNIFMDLIMIYQQFFNNSSVTYGEFKRDVTRMFPEVYDTKFMSYRLRSILPKSVSFTNTSLSELYAYFKKGKGVSVVLFSPIIENREEEYSRSESFHDAGFDSFCTGFCFIKMAHIFSVWDKKTNKFDFNSVTIGFTWFYNGIEHMKNQINIARSKVDYIVLDSADPQSSKFKLLHIRTKRSIDVIKLSNDLARYTAVDIKKLSSTTGLISVHHLHAKKVYEHFHGQDDVRVSEYNFIKHSTLGMSLVVGGIVTSALVLAVVIRSLK